MSSIFGQRASGDAWFRVGRFEVGSAVFVVLSVLASWVASMFVPGLPSLLAFSPDAVAAGHVWRIVTWPWASGFSLSGVINLFMFWYFGSDLEGHIGRRPMARLLLGIGGVLTAAYAGAALITSGGLALAGISLVEFLVLLVWIADSPRRPFFFNIPAWVFGAILLGLQVFSLVGVGAWAALLALLVSILLVGVLARREGLLSDLNWLPGRRSPRVKRPKAVRQPDAPTPKQAKQRATDEERIDSLLDKIGTEGIHALTTSERKELDKLRERRRGGR